MTHYKREYIDEIHAKGYRVTPQRLAVLDAVCEVGGHATISDIFARAKSIDPAIDHATVYRNLKVLTTIGLVVSVHTELDGVLYEIARESPHHHLMCDSCMKSIEISDDALHELGRAILQNTGFAVHVDHLVLHGLCRECQMITDGQASSANMVTQRSG